MAKMIWVRATVKMKGLNVGDVVKVNPDVPYIADAIANKYLVETIAPRRES